MSFLPSNSLTTPYRRARAYADMLFVDHGVFRILWTARHEVAPGVYRSNQPMPFQIAREARRGVKTIVNLRGARLCGSYALEAQACADHGIALIDFPVNSRDVPKREIIAGAQALFQTAQYPMLMHCKSGADRAGLMSVLYLVLREGRDVETAMGQHLSLRYGHFRQAKTGLLDFFFETYLAYAKVHPIDFYTWTQTVYDPAAVKAGFMTQWWANILVDKILGRE